MSKEILLICFITSFSLLVILVFNPDNPTNDTEISSNAVFRLKTGHQINFIPFKTISGYFANFRIGSFLINIVGNIILFMPIGFCLPALWIFWRSWKKILTIALLFPVIVETSQLFLCRFVDIDDIVLNTFGIMSGYWMYLHSKIKI